MIAAEFTPPPLAPRNPRFLPPVVEMAQICGVAGDTLPPGQWDAEEKIDGVRAIWAGGELWTREGVPLDLPEVKAELRQLEFAFGEPMAIDGEYQEPGGFVETLAVMQSRGRRAPRGTLHVFDALPLREWERGEGTAVWADRRQQLGQVWGGVMPARLALGRATPIVGMQQAQRLAELVWARGGEGLVLKRRDALYRRARSRDWLKLKREITLTGEIAEMREGARSARVQIQGRTVRVTVTTAQARTLSVGMRVQVEAQEWTEHGALRHGRIVSTGKD